MKKFKVIAFLCAFAMMATACSQVEAPVVDMDDVEASVFGEESGEAKESDAEDAADNSGSATSGAFGFAALKDLGFWFGSGAGGWHTELNIDKDGKFQGIYQEYDMGLSGKGYEGTVYYSEFNGQFSKPEKVNDTTYRFTLKSIKYPLGQTKKIVDEKMYIYTEAHGLNDGKEFYLYLPGTKVADLPEEFKEWVDASLLKGEEIDFYGLYNEAEKEGFTSFEVVSPVEKAEDILANAKAAVQELKVQRAKAKTQQEVNMLSYEIYQEWDIALNHVWSILEDELDEKTYAKVFEEEEKWIATKRAMKKRLNEKFNGLSVADYAVYTEAAEMTEERAYELLEYLK